MADLARVLRDAIDGGEPELRAACRALLRAGHGPQSPQDAPWRQVYRQLMEQAVWFLRGGEFELARETCGAAVEVALLDGSKGWVDWARECLRGLGAAQAALRAEPRDRPLRDTTGEPCPDCGEVHDNGFDADIPF